MADVADNWEDDDEEVAAEVAAPAPAAEEAAAPGLSFNPSALAFNPNAGSFTPSWMGASEPAAEAAPAADGEDEEVEAISDDVVGLILTGADPVPEAQAPAEPAAPAESRTMAEIEAEQLAEIA